MKAHAYRHCVLIRKEYYSINQLMLIRNIRTPDAPSECLAFRIGGSIKSLYAYDACGKNELIERIFYQQPAYVRTNADGGG